MSVRSFATNLSLDAKLHQNQLKAFGNMKKTWRKKEELLRYTALGDSNTESQVS